jgi:hypothetical protein
MTLPYPHEVETGELEPRRPAPRPSFDIERHLHDAIRERGSELELFGVPMEVEPPESLRAVAERLRRAVADHFQQRMSAPDEQTWASFASQAHDQLQGHRRVDAATLQVLRLTIDNL